MISRQQKLPLAKKGINFPILNIFNKIFAIVLLFADNECSGGSRGGSSSSPEPPFQTNYFINGKFSENQEKLIINQVKLTNRTPMNPHHGFLDLPLECIILFYTFVCGDGGGGNL